MSDLAKKMLIKLDENTEKFSSHRIDHEWNHASELGWADDCIGHLVLKRLNPEKEEGRGIETKRRLAEGMKQEGLMRMDLLSSGYQMEKVHPFTWPELKVKGTVDDILVVDGQGYPIDYKSCSSQIFRKIQRHEVATELLRSDFIWIRHYPAQIFTYDKKYNKDLGFLMFKDKQTGENHIVDAPIDNTYVEQLVEKIQEVNEWVRKGELPEPHQVEACRSCGFWNVCFPGEQLREQVTVISEPDLEMMLRRRDETKEIHDEHEDLDKECKAQLRGISSPKIMIGDFLVNKTEYEAKVYNVPPEIKEQYKGLAMRVRISIKNLGKAL